MRHPVQKAIFHRLAARWAVVLLGVVLAHAALHAPAQARAASAAQNSGIQVMANTAVMQHPQQVIFRLQATSAAVIDQVIVVYGYAGHGCEGEGTRQQMSITPGRYVQGYWVKDFARSWGFLPGAELWWQYEIHDRSGGTLTTERQTMIIMDTNHSWHTLEEGRIQLMWYEGSQQFGARLVDHAANSLKKLAKEAGVQATGKIRIMVYPESQEMIEITGGGREWAGGLAFGEYDLIYAAISPVDNVNWAEEVLTHELTHLITSSGFVDCQSVRLPLWLVEGIAEFTEGPLTLEEELLVRDQLSADMLPKLKTMRHNFPAGAEEARLAYAQSAMVVSYMIEANGVEKFHQLVDTIRGGQTIDQALRLIYGMNTDELDQAWRAAMGYGEAPELNFVTETPVPTRTPIPTLNLKPSLWTSGLRTPTAAASPTLTATTLPTAMPPATRTPIPTGKPTHTPASTAPAQKETNPWLLLVGGVTATVGLVAGVSVWVIRRVR